MNNRSRLVNNLLCHVNTSRMVSYVLLILHLWTKLIANWSLTYRQIESMLFLRWNMRLLWKWEIDFFRQYYGNSFKYINKNIPPECESPTFMILRHLNDSCNDETYHDGVPLSSSCASRSPSCCDNKRSLWKLKKYE